MDWGYVAGYFDGEGSASHFVRSERGQRVELSFFNNHLSSLEAIRDFVGAGRIVSRPRKNERCKPAYALFIAKSADVARVGAAMLPHLLIKADRVRSLIQIAASIEPRSAAYGWMAAASPDEVRALYDGGLTQAQVAARYGVTRAAAKRYFKCHGIVVRPRGSEIKGRPCPEHVREAVRASTKARWADADARAAFSAAMRAGKARQFQHADTVNA